MKKPFAAHYSFCNLNMKIKTLGLGRGPKQNKFHFAAFLHSLHSLTPTACKHPSEKPTSIVTQNKPILNQVFLMNLEVRPVSLQEIYDYQHWRTHSLDLPSLYFTKYCWKNSCFRTGSKRKSSMLILG